MISLHVECLQVGSLRFGSLHVENLQVGSL